MSSSNNTRVQVATVTLRTSRESANPYEDDIPKPHGQIPSDARATKGLCRSKKNILFGQLNSRSLSSTSAKEELDKHINDFDISVTCIQEHRQVHIQEDPPIKATRIGRSTIFTVSATRNRQGAEVGGVGVVVKCALLQNLVSVTMITDRIIHALFKGNPKTLVILCYSPTNISDEKDVVEFYESLNQTVLHIPSHTCLVIGGDFNAQISNGFSYHSNTNRNGQLLLDFIHEHNLLMTNTLFCKPKSRLWTFRAPNKFK